MSSRVLTPLGELLEAARTEVLQISVREAARRARMSEGRWRQIVLGMQAKGGGAIPVKAPPRTVVAMSLAVGVDPAQALRAAGAEASDVSVAAMVAEVHQPRAAAAPRPDTRKLVDEIERIRDMRGIPPEDKIRMVNAIVDLYEERAAAADG
jgi:hypothetical protein